MHKSVQELLQHIVTTYPDVQKCTVVECNIYLCTAYPIKDTLNRYLTERGYHYRVERVEYAGKTVCCPSEGTFYHYRLHLRPFDMRDMVC